MTEYWVSQGNKWCDSCKIYISNNPLSIRTHELGQRHKDSVAKRLATLRKDNAAKEKEQKEAARALEQIEVKANRSYQKDLAALREAEESSSRGSAKPFAFSRDEWEFDTSSSYYVNRAYNYYYDAMSGLYYSDALGKWAAQEEAFPAFQGASGSQKEDGIAPGSEDETGLTEYQKGTPPGLVIPGSKVNPKRAIKGAPSSIAVKKRKKQDLKPKALSKEEVDALRAREAAKKRIEEREKPLLGLHKYY